MFENYIAKQPKSRRSWRTIIFSVSVISHAGFAAVLLIVGMWQVDKLTLPKQQPIVVSSLPLPHIELSEPPSERIKIPPRRQAASSRASRELVQSDQQSAEESELELGAPDIEGHDAGGVDERQSHGCSGVCLPVMSDGPSLPVLLSSKPPAPRPIVIPAKVLNGTRVSGNARIQPPDLVLTTMTRDGTQRLQGSIRICVDRSGQVSLVSILDSTGYEAYDHKLLSEMRAWRYRPYHANGEAIPVCSSITFIYVQKD